MSGTIDSATSAITSARCRRRMPGADVPLRPDFSGSMCSRRVIRSAGIDPHTGTPSRQRHREQGDRHIDGKTCDWRGRLVGRSQSSSAIAAIGDEQAGRATAGREQRALGQQLRDDARAAGAEGGAHGDLPLARLGSRQQQVGDVHAGDQQHERHGHAERHQRRLDARGQQVLRGRRIQPRVARRSAADARRRRPRRTCAARHSPAPASPPAPAAPSRRDATRRADRSGRWETTRRRLPPRWSRPAGTGAAPAAARRRSATLMLLT